MVIDRCPECQRLWDSYGECVYAARQVRQERLEGSYDERNRLLDRDLKTLEQQRDILRNRLANHHRQEHRANLFQPVLVERAVLRRAG